MRNDRQPSTSFRSPRELLVMQIDKGAVLLLLAGLAALALVFLLLFRPASGRDSAPSTFLSASTLGK